MPDANAASRPEVVQRLRLIFASADKLERLSKRLDQQKKDEEIKLRSDLTDLVLADTAAELTGDPLLNRFRQWLELTKTLDDKEKAILSATAGMEQRKKQAEEHDLVELMAVIEEKMAEKSKACEDFDELKDYLEELKKKRAGKSKA